MSCLLNFFFVLLCVSKYERCYTIFLKTYMLLFFFFCMKVDFFIPLTLLSRLEIKTHLLV